MQGVREKVYPGDIRSQPRNELSSGAPDFLPFQVNKRQRLSEYVPKTLPLPR